jgi:ribosomal protein S18 acetylase RimI-like enzyme
MSADVKVAVADAKTFEAVRQFLSGESAGDPMSRDSVAEIAPENVIVASVEDRVVGAIVSQVAAGRVGWIWPPAVGRIEGTAVTSSQIARRLVAAAAAKLAGADCRLIQSLLPPGDTRGNDLEASGFVLITEMIRMERECTVRSDWTHESGGLDFVSYEQATGHKFEEVIEQTYCESLDCPELDGVRTVTEALESYKAAGSFRPDLWLLARQRGNWVGCVLLSNSPAEGSCELQYMGVVPHSRGRQIGRILCERALLDARRVGASHLILSVDSRNRPAIDHYNAMRFIETDRRRVYIHKLAPIGSANRK